MTDTRRKRVRAAIWARATIEGLEVTGDILGATHTFEHDGRSVEIKIPSVPLDADLRPMCPDEKPVSFRSGNIANATLQTNTYGLGWVEISMRVTERLSIPSRLLEMTPKRPEIAGGKLTQRLDRLILSYEARLAGALKYWERVVRWISGSSALGTPNWTPSRESSLRLQLTSFVQVEDNHRFWLPTQSISLLKGVTLDGRVWNAIRTALASGADAPIWFQYIDDAHHRYRAWDPAGTILSCAIACETLAREVFWISSGKTELEASRDLLDRVPVRGILDRWRKLTTIEDEVSRIRDVSRLFSMRNRLMHAGGRHTNLDLTETRELLSAAKAFIRTADEWYYVALRKNNPRVGSSEEVLEKGDSH